jgi:hypothetical protein
MVDQIGFYSINEIHAAYSLLSIYEQKQINTWHEAYNGHISLRTTICKEIIDSLQKRYHCMGVDVEKVAVQLEHYHFVVSVELDNYLDAFKIQERINYCTNLLQIPRINCLKL